MDWHPSSGNSLVRFDEFPCLLFTLFDSYALASLFFAFFCLVSLLGIALDYVSVAPCAV